MAVKQPNTICKNRNCTKGSDGNRKHYYTCRYCLNQATWRSMACSEECYTEYMKQVAEARSKSEPLDLFPERTDITPDEVKSIVLDEPIDVAVAITKEELKDEFEENPNASIAEIIDQINSEIDEERGE